MQYQQTWPCRSKAYTSLICRRKDLIVNYNCCLIELFESEGRAVGTRGERHEGNADAIDKPATSHCRFHERFQVLGRMPYQKRRADLSIIFQNHTPCGAVPLGIAALGWAILQARNKPKWHTTYGGAPLVVCSGKDRQRTSQRPHKKNIRIQHRQPCRQSRTEAEKGAYVATKVEMRQRIVKCILEKTNSVSPGNKLMWEQRSA
jgi:hypothetical protein